MGVAMEQFNSEQVRRIWNRVQSGAAYAPSGAEPKERDVCLNLSEMIAREAMGKAMFMQLAGRFPGKNGVMLRQMAKQEQSHSAILRGICKIAAESPPAVKIPQLTATPTPILLRRCYGQCLQNLSEYEKRASDPQFGGTFERMAQQEQEHCRILLALLGSLPIQKRR